MVGDGDLEKRSGWDQAKLDPATCIVCATPRLKRHDNNGLSASLDKKRSVCLTSWETPGVQINKPGYVSFPYFESWWCNRRYVVGHECLARGIRREQVKDFQAQDSQ